MLYDRKDDKESPPTVPEEGTQREESEGVPDGQLDDRLAAADPARREVEGGDIVEKPLQFVPALWRRQHI